MATRDMTASKQSRPEQVRTKDVPCPPMTNQNFSGHGYEMYPQQFVRLVGCHDASLDALRKRADEKVH